MKELRPIPQPLDEFQQIEDLLMKYFRLHIYYPLMQELRKPKTLLTNAIDRDVLVDAIIKGDIYYYRGYFKGKFNAQITREMNRLGGVWSAKQVGFRVLQEKIPYPIQTAILNSQTAFMRVVERLDKKIQQILPANFADLIPLEKIFEKLIYKVDGDVQETMKAITIQPKISKEQAQQFADPYVGEVRASIKGWTEEQMKSLRMKVQQSVLDGNRYEGLIKDIQDSYGVSQSKAKFLARQETNLMTVKLKENRYKDAGVNEYRWVCVKGSPLHPVRPEHQKNNNQVFSFDNPPIVNKNGDRKNPGEDYNCRCTAIPIVRFNESET